MVIISAIEFLDNDVNTHLGLYIKTKKNYTIVLKELIDNVLYTTHINYYKKYFKSKDIYLKEMTTNKDETLEKIKTLKDKKGWIVNYPTKFSWGITRNEFINNYNIESHNNNLILKDKVTGWEYRSYPPHSRHYNIKDLLKNIK